ncbi:MAG: D-amino-acid transaminase [Beijerinckiaceae bacterium]|nr:D-amino-acid transaminase [Beijerinckiaceae bacterium]
MSRIAYVNGRYTPLAQARVHIEDRGYQFADGVYEVVEVFQGALIDEQRHLDRLARSLRELRIAAPLGDGALRIVLREIIARNKLRDGFVYLQVTRGVARRDHFFPDPPPRPSLVVTARLNDPAKIEAKAAHGIGVTSMPDLRWKRPDIKTINLIANVLAKQAAKEQGSSEAWLIGDDGMITEGGSSNAWIITPDGTLVTHPVNNGILSGVTRATLMTLIGSLGLRVEERRFSLAEAHAAREAFVTSATSLVTPVVSIDGSPVGDGKPGPVASRLRERFHVIAPRTR